MTSSISGAKSSVDEIRARFDSDVERFSNLSTGQTATIDAAECMDLVATAAAAATRKISAVLDLGCGAGNYSLKLRERAPDAAFTLVDLSEPMLARAQERLAPSPTTLIQRDLRELDWNEPRFDVILAAAVLHHLRTPAEWANTFQKFHRWLRPGGSVWIFDLVSHENEAVQALLWTRYGRYLEGIGGPNYREKVFAYIDREDTPTPLTAQLEWLRAAGFAQIDVLHKNASFAAFGAVKTAH
jgi:tRNA (cmo5U34)-methyltransferase